MRTPDFTDAACRDMNLELFYPKKSRDGERTQYRDAIRVCQACPIRVACLDWAYEINDGWAILGGLSPRQRGKTRAAWNRKRAS